MEMNDEQFKQLMEFKERKRKEEKRDRTMFAFLFLLVFIGLLILAAVISFNCQCPCPYRAHSREVEKEVEDLAGNPVPNATVTLSIDDTTYREAVTGPDGKVKWTHVYPNTYTLDVYLEGEDDPRKTHTVDVTSSDWSETNTLNFYLSGEMPGVDDGIHIPIPSTSSQPYGGNHE